jgi:hypothetical protein
LTCDSLNRMEKLAANALTTIAIILVFLTRIMAIVVQMTRSFENFMVWLLILSVELVIGAAIFVILKRYD